MGVEQTEDVIQHVVHFLRVLFQILVDVVLEHIGVVLGLDAERIDEAPHAVKPRFALAVCGDGSRRGGQHGRRKRECGQSFR